MRPRFAHVLTGLLLGAALAGLFPVPGYVLAHQESVAPARAPLGATTTEDLVVRVFRRSSARSPRSAPAPVIVASTPPPPPAPPPPPSSPTKDDDDRKKRRSDDDKEKPSDRTRTIGTAIATTRMRRVPRARYLLVKRMGWWGIALTAWDLWRRIPKKHRKRMLRELRQHAPTVARGLTREARRIRDTAREAARTSGRR